MMKLSRRALLAGSSISILLGSFGSLEAGRALRGGGAGGSVLPSMPATVINGFDENGQSFAFQNFAKLLGSFGGSASAPAYLTSDGYPTSGFTAAGVSYGGVMAMDAPLLDPTVTWVCSWQGLGGIQISNGTSFGSPNFTITAIGAGTTVSGNTTAPATLTNVAAASGTNGYFEFTNGAGASQLALNFSQFGMTFDGSMANLQVYRKSDQNIAGTGTKGTFTSEFLNLFNTTNTGLNPLIFRSLDWNSTNSSNVSQYQALKATTAVSYLSQSFNPTYMPSSKQTSAQDAFTCTNPSASGSGAYVDGEIIQVQFVGRTINQTITAVADNGSGAIRLTIGSTTGMLSGETYFINGVGNGYTIFNPLNGANNDWPVTVVNSTQIDLIGSSSSGGTPATGLSGTCLNTYASTTNTIIGTANNGSGAIRLQLSNASLFSGGGSCTVSNVGGTVEANGQWTITFIDSTHVDLVGSTYINAFVASTTATAIIFKSPTLNVASRGTVPLGAIYGALPLGAPLYFNQFSTLTYLAATNVWATNSQGSRANNAGGGLTTGVPLAMQIALCNALGCDFYFNIPAYFATNGTAPALTDIGSLVSQIAGALGSSQKCYFEYTNELWNFLNGQTSYAGQVGAALGFPTSSSRILNGFYSLKVKQVMTKVRAAWVAAGRTTATLRCVIANWEGDPSIQFASGQCRWGGLDLNNTSISITGISASATAPTVTAPNSYAQTQQVVLSGITGAGAISALNGQTVTVLQPTATNFIIGTLAWSGSGTCTGTSFIVTSGKGTLAIGQYLDVGGGNQTKITAGSGASWTISPGVTSNPGTTVLAYTPVSTAGGTYSSGGSLETLYASLGYGDYSLASPTFSRAIDVCDVTSYATYYASPNTGGNSGDLSSNSAIDNSLLTGAADNYASGNPTQMTAALAWLDNNLRYGGNTTDSVTLSGGSTFTNTTLTAPTNGNAMVGYTIGTPFGGMNYTQFYYVVNSGVGGAKSFQLSATFGGSPITGITAGSGTQYFGISGGETLLWHRNFYYATSNTRGFGYAQLTASFNASRPSGMSPLYIVIYEGGLENLPPSQKQCNDAGISGSVYGDFGGRISSLIIGYKNSALAKQLVIDQFNDVINTSVAAGVSTVIPSWFAVQGFSGQSSQWSLMPGSTFGPLPPFQSFNGYAAFNH